MANKKRLVLISEVETELRAYADRKHACGQTELANGILKAVNHLQTISTAKDAVEVVRCKDCKHRYAPKSEKCRPFCTKQFGMHARDDDFCSCGERKDNDKKQNDN